MRRNPSGLKKRESKNHWDVFFRLLKKSYRGTALGSMEKRDPFRVLVSTVISQRTKDETTVRVSAALFSRFRNASQIASAPPAELEKILKSSGFYRQKARHIRALSLIVSRDLSNRVPDTMDALLQLPGVGRKTAACVLNFGFGKPAIAVDTHVHRISNRLGWVKTKHPNHTEQALMKFVPLRYWVELNDLIVSHGKSICRPRMPKCSICPVEKYCHREGVKGLD